MSKEILFIDMDNVLVDFSSGLNKMSEEVKSLYTDDGKGKPHFDDIPGIFSLMSPMPGAVESVHNLSKMYDVYILSTAPWGNPSAWSDKLEWVKKNFDSDNEDGVFYKRLILSHHKELCLQDNAFLIDDRPNNGADAFGERWLSFGKNGKFKNWNEVEVFLTTRKK